MVGLDCGHTKRHLQECDTAASCLNMVQNCVQVLGMDGDAKTNCAVRVAGEMWYSSMRSLYLYGDQLCHINTIQAHVLGYVTFVPLALTNTYRFQVGLH